MVRLVFLLFFMSVSSFAQNRMNAEGKREGVWEGYYEKTGNLKYRGSFINGVEQGVFTYYTDQAKQQKMSTLDYSKGNGNAYGIFFDEKGNKRSEGNYKNRKREGKWMYYHPGGKQILSEEFYINDKLEGTKKVFYTTGKTSEEINYKNGLLHGASVQYSEDGIKLREENYVDDVRQGKAVYRDRKGNVVAEGEYKNGLKIGAWANESNTPVKPVRKK